MTVPSLNPFSNRETFKPLNLALGAFLDRLNPFSNRETFKLR